MIHINMMVITESAVLEGCHSDTMGGGHFGRDKTFGKVSKRFYWVGVIEDVKRFCPSCDKCQRVNQSVKSHILVFSL